LASDTALTAAEPIFRSSTLTAACGTKKRGGVHHNAGEMSELSFGAELEHTLSSQGIGVEIELTLKEGFSADD
jgi:hypothetical protein